MPAIAQAHLALSQVQIGAHPYKTLSEHGCTFLFKFGLHRTVTCHHGPKNIDDRSPALMVVMHLSPIDHFGHKIIKAGSHWEIYIIVTNVDSEKRKVMITT